MLQVRPFQEEDIATLVLQARQAEEGKWLAAIDLVSLSQSGQSFTGLVEGVPLICAGVIGIWPGRAMAWAYLSRDAGRNMRSITTAVRKFLDETDHRRVEMTTIQGFQAAARWAEMLGFRLEGLMTQYTPDGEDAYLWARVKGVRNGSSF
jgi:RimJ/RimL family protein N-acetyltransferase